MCAARPPNNQHQSIIAKVLCVFLIFDFIFYQPAKVMLVQHFFFNVETGQIDTPERGAGKSKSRGKGPGKGKEDQRSNEASLY